MPEVRYYEVTQVRMVRVTANSEVDAMRIGAAAFQHGQDSSFGVAKDKGPEGVWGNTTSEIDVEELRVERI